MLEHKHEWFEAHSSGVDNLSFETFSLELGKLARSHGLLGVDPQVAWIAVVNGEKMTKFEFERLSIPVYQCLVQVCKVTSESDPSSLLFGWVATEAHGRSCFLRVWPSISLQPWDMLDGSEMTDGEEDRNIDEALGLEANDDDGMGESVQNVPSEAAAAALQARPKAVAKAPSKPEE